GATQPERECGQVGAKAAGIRVIGAEEIGHARARGRDHRVGLAGARERAVRVGAAAGHVAAHRVDDPAWHLAARRTVEIRDRPAAELARQRRELWANPCDIEAHGRGLYRESDTERRGAGVALP